MYKEEKNLETLWVLNTKEPQAVFWETNNDSRKANLNFSLDCATLIQHSGYLYLTGEIDFIIFCLNPLLQTRVGA